MHFKKFLQKIFFNLCKYLNLIWAATIILLKTREYNFIKLMYQYREAFFITIIIYHLVLLAWQYPDFVSSALFWVLTIIFTFMIGYEKLLTFYLKLFNTTNSTDPEVNGTSRFIFYINLIGLIIHGGIFKPNPKFISSILVKNEK